MKRYKKANEGIHAPEELKEKTARPSQKSAYPRWAGAVAAVLAVVLVGTGIMASQFKNSPFYLNHIADGISFVEPGEPAPFSENNPGEARNIPGNNDGEETAYGGGTHKALALAEAVYDGSDTQVPPMPDWDDFAPEDDSQEAWEQADAAWLEAMETWRKVAYAAQYRLAENETIGGFVTASTAQFLTGAGEENRVYSPLNLYMALAMLAETAGGDSRQQILDALGEDSIEALRVDAAALWQSYYQDDDMGISVMANSLWLRDDMTYSQDTLKTLAEQYYASSFAGEMGSAEYDQALRDWINEQTRGLLTEQSDGLEMAPETVLGLVSSLYFKAAWSDPFDPDLNTREVFHAPSGDVETEFLHSGDWFDGYYYWGEHFGAISLGFQASGYKMWLLLPDEGYSVDDLIASGEAMEFLLSDKYGTYDSETGEEVGGWPNKKFLTINLSLPKFDVSSDLDLIGGLKALGVTDVFDTRVSNFDPLGASTDDPLYVSAAQHAARVAIDEEGCTAAAYVDLMVCGNAAPPDEKVDFILDRPFLFAITGNSELPLFTGVVNQPNG